MFTGIVQARVQVTHVQSQNDLARITLTLPNAQREGVNLGASIAIDGVCLTVTSFEPTTGEVTFDAMKQTLDTTTLGFLKNGDVVNLERSFTVGQEVGGHIISGHVDAMVDVLTITPSANNYDVTYRYPLTCAPYLFNKGFVGLHGCSLTIADINKDERWFRVSYIPETLKTTTHGLKAVGDRLNIEIDRQTQVIVDTVERVMAERTQAS